MFYDYVRALLGSPQALKNTKLKLLKPQSSLHLTHFYNKDIPRHVRTGEWPYIYGQKIHSLPIWICVEIRGFPFPSRYILTAQNSCEVGYTSCNLWPSTSTDRSRNGRLVQHKFSQQEMEGFVKRPQRCFEAKVDKPRTYVVMRKNIRNITIIWQFFHFRSDS